MKIETVHWRIEKKFFSCEWRKKEIEDQEKKLSKQKKGYNHCWGARGVMGIVAGNGHGDTSSNPGRDWLHLT